MNQSLKSFLLENIKVDGNDCWIWQGNRDKENYGSSKWGGAHRFSAMLFLDFDINSKLLVCHHCDNPPCVNPDHLFIGTYQDNTNDMLNKGRYINGMLDKKHSEDAKTRMSISHKGKKLTEEHRQKISKSLEGNTRSLGRRLSEEHKLKNSKSLEGNTRTLGYKYSEETKIKMSESTKLWHKNNPKAMLGRKHSELTKQKIRLTMLSKKRNKND